MPDMTDYTGNSNKGKKDAARAAKKVDKVVTGDVKIQKKPIGRRFKELIVQADFKNVLRFIGYDVLLPAARNTIVDASTKGIERMMYGEAAARHRVHHPQGPRITYNSPISRSVPYNQPIPGRPVQSRLVPGESRSPRYSRGDIVLSNRDEADLVLERMQDIIDKYEVVSVSDLYELLGLPSSYQDNKWGWNYLGDVQVRQIREGYLIDFPSAEPIQ